MSQSYLSLANQGKNAWWRYVLTLILILFCSQIFGAIPLLLIIAVAYGPDNLEALESGLDLADLQEAGIPPVALYLGINFTLIAALVGLAIAVHTLHERPLLTLITPQRQINWQRLGQGFGVYFVLLAIVSLGSVLLAPSTVEFTFEASQFFPFLPIALIVTPLQAGAEELFFRGYLMQAIALKTRGPILPMVVSSLLFMVIHLANPEVGAGLIIMALIYFLLGLFFAFITVRDNSLELAIATHAANNLFIVLVLNYSNSALPSPSIFTSSDINPFKSLITVSLLAIAFCWLMFFSGKSTGRKSPNRHR